MYRTLSLLRCLSITAEPIMLLKQGMSLWPKASLDLRINIKASTISHQRAILHHLTHLSWMTVPQFQRERSEQCSSHSQMAFCRTPNVQLNVSFWKQTGFDILLFASYRDSPWIIYGMCQNKLSTQYSSPWIQKGHLIDIGTGVWDKQVQARAYCRNGNRRSMETLPWHILYQSMW